ncbi:MAG: YggS family pyridoxal phosphate-dependent enzyme [Clostridia bacterium]|nr:YggS family pyridoxal phosphate-dependent enzyme [Clostridia bacterium]
MNTRLSDDYKQSIRSSIEKINSDILISSEKRSGPKAVLCAATKTVPAEAVNFAARECGLRCIGENRVQELLAKYDELDRELLDIHFIGRLQTNKVKYIVDKVSMIHSVDSVRLAEEIEKRCAEKNKVMDVLIELNVGEEENKGGVMPNEFDALAEKLVSFEHIKVRGIMTIGPICAKECEYFEFFKKTYHFFIDILPKKIHNIYNPVLSMGMSDSYNIALECGSTMIRPGSAIFGRRDYITK